MVCISIDNRLIDFVDTKELTSVKIHKHKSELEYERAIYILQDIHECSRKLRVKDLERKDILLSIGRAVLKIQKLIIKNVNDRKAYEKIQDEEQLKATFKLLIEVINELFFIVKRSTVKRVEYSVLVDVHEFLSHCNIVILSRYLDLYWSVPESKWQKMYSYYISQDRKGSTRFTNSHGLRVRQNKDFSKLSELLYTCNLLYKSN
jgi:hypothetical protein